MYGGNGTITLFSEHNTDNEAIKRYFRIFETGQTVFGQYLGTVQMFDNSYRHLYEQVVHPKLENTQQELEQIVRPIGAPMQSLYPKPVGRDTVSLEDQEYHE